MLVQQPFLLAIALYTLVTPVFSITSLKALSPYCKHLRKSHHIQFNYSSLETRTGYCLKRGESLSPGSCIQAGNYFLGLTGFGVAVQGILHPNYPVVWYSKWPKNSLKGPFNLQVSKSGDVQVTERKGRIVWDTKTNRTGSYFCIDSKGGLEVVNERKHLIWKKPLGDCRRIGVSEIKEGQKSACMKPGDVLTPCESIRATPNAYLLFVNGSISVYNQTQLVGHPGTTRVDNAYFVYQTNGDVALYNQLGFMTWSSQTQGLKSTDLCVTEAGKLSLYNGQHRIWTAKLGDTKSKTSTSSKAPAATSATLSEIVSSSVSAMPYTSTTSAFSGNSSSTSEQTSVSAISTRASTTSRISTVDFKSVISSGSIPSFNSSLSGVERSAFDVTSKKLESKKPHTKGSDVMTHVRTAPHASYSKKKTNATWRRQIGTKHFHSTPSPTRTESITEVASGTETVNIDKANPTPTLPYTMYLNVQNTFRSGYGVPPLVYNSSAAASAQTHATNLAAQGCAVSLGEQNGNGQNVGGYEVSGNGTLPSFGYFLNMWEEAGVKNGTFTAATQILWRQTTSVGCAYADGSVGEFRCRIAVCDYYPPGNYEGESWNSTAV